MPYFRRLIERALYRYNMWVQSPWHNIAQSRLEVIESQRVELDKKQQSIDHLIALLHSTEAARDLYKVELHDVEAELVRCRAELTEEYYDKKEIR